MSEGDRQELPKGWALAPLGELADKAVEQLGANRREKFVYVDIGSVDNRTKRICERNEVSGSSAPSRAKQNLRRGDVLVSMTRPNLNAVAMVGQEFDGAVGSTGFHVLRSSAIEPSWLFHAVQTHRFISAMCSVVQGALYPAVRPKDIDSWICPVPPRAEQSRIADALDELLSDLDAGVAALERVRAKLKHYRAAVLKAAVEGTLTAAAKPFPIRPIGQAIESLGQGWSPKCESQPAQDSETWAVIKTTAIQPLRYMEEHNKQLPSALSPRPHLELQAGDLLITRAGPRSRVGIACMVKQTRPRLMLCDKAYRLRCKPDTLTPAFLEVVLNAPNIVTELDALKTGINDSGLNLTQDRFSELRVPFPSPPEQAAIVEAVEDQLSVIEHLEGDLDAKLKSAQALRQSLLRHAFTGQLVPQDPNDEPAEELLKRIAAEREERTRQARAAKQAKPKTKTPRGRAAKA